MEYWTIFFPLIGALSVFFINIGYQSTKIRYIPCIFILLSCIGSGLLFYEVLTQGMRKTIVLWDWMILDSSPVQWALRFDSLSVLMVTVVNSISCCVHFYSLGYMKHDPGITRFMGYLSLFTFFMLMLVTANNFVQMFFGWEGVGLASYLLIGFWYERPSANEASIKAFVINRIGDFGLCLGIACIFSVFNSLNFDIIFSLLPEYMNHTHQIMGITIPSITLICGLLFLGAMGKSAQLGLHVWLPDAMEGPTPVSALIHAATMVTAGVFIVARLWPLFEQAPEILNFITILGALTAFFAATVALTQYDIKRIIAYSTCSQLGYMFMAAGVSAYHASIFHLFTHAFFKALLFLGAGSIIHALSHEQDLRYMGGLRSLIPWPYGCMWIGNLALAGIPFFAGYYSKDLILEALWSTHTTIGRFGFYIGLIVAYLTAFYSWRLLYLAFHGKSRANERVLAHVHESPLIMIVPLIFLSLGSLFSGKLFQGVFQKQTFWGSSLMLPIKNIYGIPFWVEKAPVITAVLGILSATVCYGGKFEWPLKEMRFFPFVHKFLLNKWYFDELYQIMYVNPLKKLSLFFSKKIDIQIIDQKGPVKIMTLTKDFAEFLSSLQTGYLYHYATAIFIGVVAFIGCTLWLN